MNPSSLTKREFLFTGAPEYESDLTYKRPILDGYSWAFMKGHPQKFEFDDVLVLPRGTCYHHWDTNLDHQGLGVLIDGTALSHRSYFSYFGKIKPKVGGRLPFNNFVRLVHEDKRATVTHKSKNTTETGWEALPTGLLPSLTPIWSSPAGGYTRAVVDLGYLEMFAMDTAQALREIQYMALRAAIKQLHVTDLGETLVEFLSIKSMLTSLRSVIKDDLVLIFHKLKAIGTTGGLWAFLDSLARIHLTWSYMLRPLLEIGKELYERWGNLSYSPRVHALQYRNSYKLADFYQTDFGISASNFTGDVPLSPHCKVFADSIGGVTTSRCTVDGRGTWISPGDGSGQPIRKISISTSVDVRTELEVQADRSAIFEQLGLNNPFLTAYQVLPLSFVFEAVISLEGMLNRLAYTDGFKVLNQNQSLTFNSLLISGAGSTQKSELKLRERLGSNGAGWFDYYPLLTWTNPTVNVQLLRDVGAVPIGDALAFVGEHVTIGTGVEDLSSRTDLLALFQILLSSLRSINQSEVMRLTLREKSKLNRILSGI